MLTLYSDDEYKGMLFTKTLDTRTCPNCGDVVAMDRDSMGIQVVVTNSEKCTLQQLIDKTLNETPENVEESLCEACGGRWKRPVKSGFITTPEVLFIHIQATRNIEFVRGRTEAEISAKRGFKPNLKKINPVNLQYGLWLDLSKHQLEGHRKSCLAMKYRLASASFHMGSDYSSGHYVGGYTSPSGIFGANDTVAGPIDVGTLLGLKSPEKLVNPHINEPFIDHGLRRRKPTPYVLVYIRDR
jgi:hypothetical protein